MQTEVTNVSKFEKRMTLTLTESEFDSAKDKASRKLAKSMKIKGFRPGKAPRAVVERMVGSATLRSEAIDDALPGLVGNGLREADLTPVTNPKVENLSHLDDGGVELNVLITLWPSIDTVPVTEGRQIEIEAPSVDDQDIDDQIERLQSQFAELEDVARSAAEGDFVLINITAANGEGPIESASTEEFLYEIGSRSFFMGLDDLLPGASAGEIRSGPGMLPPGYGDASGEVTLTVLVKGVKGKVLPEINDEWASDISEFETVAELRDQIEQSVYATKLDATGKEFREKLLEEVIGETEMELPADLVEAEMEASVADLAQTLQQQGVDFSSYFRITGQDQDEYLSKVRSRAANSIKARVLLEAVAERDGVSVEEEDVAASLAGLASQTGKDVSQMRAAMEENGQLMLLRSDILRRKALDLILEGATAVNAAGLPVDLVLPDLDADLEKRRNRDRENVSAVIEENADESD